MQISNYYIIYILKFINFNDIIGTNISGHSLKPDIPCRDSVSNIMYKLWDFCIHRTVIR